MEIMAKWTRNTDESIKNRMQETEEIISSIKDMIKKINTLV